MTGRILGLDLARALAILGMVAAHVGDDATTDDTGWPWLWVTHGRSSALFAVLAGVTMSLMLARAGGRDDARGVTFTRGRVAARAAVLIGVGLVLDALETPVDVILVNLGLMFLLALTVLRWPSWALVSTAGAVIAVGTAALARITPAGWLETAPVVGRLWSDHYPALTWIAYVMLGVAIGRLALRSGETQALLAGVGTMAASAAALVRIVVGDGPLTTLEPHSYSPLEMTQNAGVAAAVIGAACWLAPRARTALVPLTALGSMALSAYVLHLLVIAAVGPEMVYEASNVALVALVATLIALAWAWQRWLGQGPLERVLTMVANAAGESAVRDSPRAGSVTP